MEIILAKLAPHTAFKDELAHDGVDIALVLQLSTKSLQSSSAHSNES